MVDTPEFASGAETPPSPEPPRGGWASRAKPAALVGVAVLLAGGAWVVLWPSPWQSGVTVESYRATVEGSKLELCASGHFDQGVLGELLYSMGMQPTDVGLQDCVSLLFEEALATGTYRIAGQGPWRVNSEAESATFNPGEGHASVVKVVWFDRGCFCSREVTEVGFDGTLSLTALDPPRGRLSLEVGSGGGEPSARIDIALASFEWKRPDVRRSLSEFTSSR